MKKRAAVRGISTLTLAAFALTACSSTDNGGNGDSSQNETTTGGTLVYATGDAEPTCLDPHVGGNYPQALISTQYLEPLVGRNAEGQIVPWLATEWQVSGDGLTWDFTLRDDITFTDGTAFDAEAVAVNIAHLQDPDTASSTGYLAVAKVTDVEAVSATHARFTLSSPDSALLESLSQPWNAIQSPAGIERGRDANCAAPVGTGPFMVQEWVPQQHITLTTNPDYVPTNPEASNDAPTIDAIEWRFIPDAATRYAALTSGEVHVIDNPQPDTIANLAEGVTHIDAPRPGAVNRIELNSNQPPFNDERVREAFLLSADVDPGIETLLHGVATRSYSPLSSVEPMAHADASLFSTDLEAAAALLDEAGWDEFDDQGYRTRNGERLTIRMPVSTNQSVAAEVSLFEQIQQNVSEVGFEMIVSPLNLSDWYGALAAHEYELVSAPYTKVGPDVLRILFHSDSTIPAPSGYFANLAQVQNPDIDAALEAASSEQDPQIRAELYEHVQQQVLEGHYLLPLYDQQNHFLTRGVDDVKTLHTVSTPFFIDAALHS